MVVTDIFLSLYIFYLGIRLLILAVRPYLDKLFTYKYILINLF